MILKCRLQNVCHLISAPMCQVPVFWFILVLSHYNNVIMSTMVSQITSPTIVYSTVYSGADHWKHPSSASLAFVRGIHRWPVNSPHKWPVTRAMFPFDVVIMICSTQPVTASEYRILYESIKTNINKLSGVGTVLNTLTCFDPSMDINHMPSKVLRNITYPF